MTPAAARALVAKYRQCWVTAETDPAAVPHPGG